MPTTYVADFIINVGPLNTQGKLVNFRAGSEREDRARLSLPDGSPVKQVYIRADAQPNDVTKIYNRSDLVSGFAKGTKDTETIAPVDKDDLKAAKSSDLPLNQLHLAVHPAKEVDAQSMPSGKVYLFVPGMLSEAYALISEVVKSSEFALMGMCNLRNVEGLYRIIARPHDGALLVVNMIMPEDVIDVTMPIRPVSSEYLSAMTEMVARTSMPFNLSTYRSSTKERMRELKEKILAGVEVVKPAKRETRTEAAFDISILKEWGK